MPFPARSCSDPFVRPSRARRTSGPPAPPPSATTWSRLPRCSGQDPATPSPPVRSDRLAILRSTPTAVLASVRRRPGPRSHNLLARSGDGGRRPVSAPKRQALRQRSRRQRSRRPRSRCRCRQRSKVTAEPGRCARSGRQTHPARPPRTAARRHQVRTGVVRARLESTLGWPALRLTHVVGLP